MSQITADINNYFDQIVPDDDRHNERLGRELLGKWGDQVIVIGFSVILDRLMKFADNSMFTFINNGDAGDKFIVNMGKECLAGFLDVICLYGDPGYKRLVSCLSHSDEDVVSLSALELSASILAKPESKQPLLDSYRRVKGDGAKLAISIALLEHGVFSPFRDYATKYLVNGEYLNALLDQSRIEKTSGISEADVYKYVAMEPGFFLVVMNIASKGRMPKSGFPEWIK